MGLLSFLRSSSQPTPDTFEKELVTLELKIATHQEKLKTIYQRQKSTTSTITIYSSLIWSIYSLIYYFEWIPPLNHSLELLPIILIPIGLTSFRWIVQNWYQRKQETEKLRLRLLQNQLRDKVEELKKKTAYYSTKDLLDRYDEKIKSNNNNQSLSPSPNNNQQQQAGRMIMTPPNNNEGIRQRGSRLPYSSPGDKPNSIGTPLSNRSPSTTNHNGMPISNLPQSHPEQRKLQNHLQQLNTPSPPPPPSHTAGKGWADRFAEVLLGDDESKPQSKYALICLNCFAHNGLVRQEELDLIQYVCPKCGTFNPPKIRSEEDEHGTKEIAGLKKKTSTTNNLNIQGKQNGAGGRKSLVESMIRKKPSSSELIDKRRVVSSAAGVPSTSSSSSGLLSVNRTGQVVLDEVVDNEEEEEEDQEEEDGQDGNQSVESSLPDISSETNIPGHKITPTPPDRKSKKKSKQIKSN
ncbi:hypothetical protein MJO28_002421 [Puccinia striiformis f. sp. tritici]|uniref:Uncharacterized protein n=1 Tax=Puccinia striiformis f. sp. tritici TaxID=168172 RepID=A0ACC0EPW5_9BASI|nr:hypothetical protein Pst134EB_006680 [Puccinia striiformis f. sp. tritici]KAI7958630.1 hypothetical protein MJO28_002421 [Puccinia striiformis f. sp. tritici]KAI9618778.1 hypothetical protein H4Q26_012029 [Puccinia striiformis f. sp. tritici PST-130]